MMTPVMGFSIFLERQPITAIAARLAAPFLNRSEYPPRVVYEVNLGVATLVVIDHRAVRTSSVPAGYSVVEPDCAQPRILDGDLILDGRSGIWRYAESRDVGEQVQCRLGVARRNP